jgi:hypothetical protein
VHVTEKEIIVRNPEGKRLLRRSRLRWEDNMSWRESCRLDSPGQDTEHRRALADTATSLRIEQKDGYFLTS